MSAMQRIVREPVLITGLVTAVFGVLVAFGVELTDVQTGSVVTLIGVVMMLLRALVTPTSEVVASQSPGASSPKAGPAADVVHQGEPVRVTPVVKNHGVSGNTDSA